MAREKRLGVLALGAAALLALAGCDKWLVEIETRIAGDGRAVRTTSIRYEGDAKEDQDRFAPFRLPEGGRIERTADRVTIHAVLAGPADARSDIVLAAEGGRQDARNELAWERKDEVFFDRYIYRERYQDSVDADGLAAAAERLHGLVRAIVLDVVAAEAGDRYDLGLLNVYLDGPFARLVHDAVRTFALEKDEKRLQARLLARVEVEGLVLTPDDERRNIELAADFVATRLEELVIAREGAPPFDARALLAEADEDFPVLEKAVEASLARLHGSAEAGEDAFGDAVRAITGDIERHAVTFVVAAALPGRVLRTNGAVDPDEPGRVVWRFDTRAVARSGHELAAETIVVKPEVLASLPRAKPALGIREILDAVTLLEPRTDEERTLLRQAIQTLSRIPKDTVREAVPEPLRETFDKLVELGSL